MKYQLNVLLKVLNKLKLWILLFIIIVIYNTFKYCTTETEYALLNFKNILGINVHIDSLMFIMQVILTILFLMFLFDFETSNSPEFLKLRKSNSKIICEKIIISLLFIIITRLIYFFIIYIPFKELIPDIIVNDIIINIIIYVFIAILFYIIQISFLKLRLKKDNY